MSGGSDGRRTRRRCDAGSRSGQPGASTGILDREGIDHPRRARGLPARAHESLAATAAGRRLPTAGRGGLHGRVADGGNAQHRDRCGVLGVRQSADADDADLSVPDLRSRADQPQPRHAADAVDPGLRLHGVLSLLDMLRRQVLGRLATRLETILGGPVLASIVNDARRRATAATSRRCAACTRCAASSPARRCCCCSMRRLAPLYFAAIFLIHPDLGFIVTVAAGILLVVIAVLNQRATSAPLGQAGAHAASRPTRRPSALARNVAGRSTPWAC